MTIVEASTLSHDSALYISNIHERIPLIWDPKRNIDEEKINQTYQSLISKRALPAIFTLLDDKNKIIGFHWIVFGDSTAHIKSTWIDEEFRGKQLCEKIKNVAETKLREKGIHTLYSRVHSSNKIMISINLRSGYSIASCNDNFLNFEKVIGLTTGIL